MSPASACGSCWRSACRWPRSWRCSANPRRSLSSIVASSRSLEAELLGTVLIVYAISLRGSGGAARAARPVLRATRHTNAAAQRDLRASLPTWCCCRCSYCPFGLHNFDGDHRCRPRVLAGAVRQRRARLVSPDPHGRQSVARGRSRSRSGSPIASALSAAVMIGASLVLNLGDAVRTATDRVQLLHPHADRRHRRAGGPAWSPCTCSRAGRSRSWRSLLRRRRPPAGGRATQSGTIPARTTIRTGPAWIH